MVKKNNLVLLGIIILGLVLRLYRWDRPLADWHSWRQADTASVTREYIRNGVDLLQPRYHDLSNIPSGLDNLEGYRMVELPFVNAFIAVSYNWTQGFGLDIHVFSRLWAIIFSLGSAAFLYGITSALVHTRAATVVTLLYVILPYNLFFHTTVLPEIPLLFFSLGAVYFWVHFCQKLSWWHLLMFTILAMLALLLKPIFVFYGFGLLYLYLKYQGVAGLFRWQLYLSAVCVVGPLILWRLWIHQFPEGIPASDWLFNGTNIRFKGAFFRWLFADRFGRLILGYWGLIPFGIGLIMRPYTKAGWFFHWIFVGMVTYLIVFATGNVTHDYYQIFIVPVLCIFAGLGIDYLLFQTPKLQVTKTITTHDRANISALGINTESEIQDTTEIDRGHFNPVTSRGLALLSILFMLAFGWFNIRDFFNINNMAIVTAGEAVDRLIPLEAKVIAPYQGDTAFLYQTNRSGWPLGFEIQDKIDKGASYYVSTSYDDEARELEAKCRLIEKTDLYILIELQCQGLES